MSKKMRIKMLLLALSLLLGTAGTYVFADYLPVCSPAPLAQMAWWGGMYPEYCLPGAMEAVGEEAEDGGKESSEPQVKVCFKYLTFLN